MKNTTPQNENFKKRLNNNRDVIINHIRKVHPKSYIQIMTNKDETLNRGKHFGAHILVDKSHYYYITFSRKDENCEFYFSINENLLKSLKHCKEDWHLLLISNGKVHTFDAKTIVDNAKLFNETTYKIPLSVENSCTNADYRYSYSKETEYKVDFKFLGNVRYNKKFDMHKKQITIAAPEYRYKRTFDSIVKAYAELTGTKVENNKVVGKPVSNAAYRKSYMSFRREIKAGVLSLINDSGETFKASVFSNIIQSVVTEAPAEVNTSLLVVDNNTTNRDVFTLECVHDNCNKQKMAVKQPDIVDKQLNTIAEKLVEINTAKYTPAEISKYVASLGSNKNMLDVYIESLTEKGLQKEAAYAAKVFDALNNIDFN